MTWADVPSDGRNGKITGYQFEYSSMSYDGKELVGDWTAEQFNNPNTHKFRFNLEQKFYKWFAFRIAGKTKVGAGVPTEYVKIRTEDSSKYIINDII